MIPKLKQELCHTIIKLWQSHLFKLPYTLTDINKKTKKLNFPVTPTHYRKNFQICNPERRLKKDCGASYPPTGLAVIITVVFTKPGPQSCTLYLPPAALWATINSQQQNHMESEEKWVKYLGKVKSRANYSSVQIQSFIAGSQYTVAKMQVFSVL